MSTEPDQKPDQKRVFDPKRHTIRVQGGREYLPVAARLVWFRQDHPDWGIVTSPLQFDIDKGFAIFQCTIFNADGQIMATATKREDVRGFGDYLEKAETGSVGRALAYCGYGTQFAPELEEGDAASAPQSRAAPAENIVPPAAPNNQQCVECQAPMTPPQINLSMGKWGRALCPTCQRRLNKPTAKA